MAKVGIFYGSTTGVTEDIANRIAEKIDGAEVFNIDGNVEELENYDVLLLGTSTWGFGDLQDDWQAVLDDLANLNLAGKKVAYFGSGDQGTFSDTFMDGMAIINEEISKTGATVIGNTSIEGYEFNESRAVEGDKFLGLALDEVNQSDLTDERIDAWVEQIKKEF